MKYNVKKLFGENVFYLANRVEVESLEAGAIEYGGATLINGKIYSNIEESEELNLNMENTIGILVPSTVEVNTTVDNKKYVEEVENTIKDFGETSTQIVCDYLRMDDEDVEDLFELYVENGLINIED